ncbi:class I SAM-dependent RNA methyltransferase [bacterium]|nr:class I SAM-dependent RNA methyltransferase [candidate division CSSED10-310 bacterium]
MRPLDNDDALLEKLREKLGPSRKQDERAELERLFGKKQVTEEDRLRQRLVKPIVNMGDIIDVTIEKLAFGGEGIARHQSVLVFIPGVVPGDTVKVSLTHVGKDLCRGEVIEVLAHSSNRIPASCPLFGTCGGCHLQCLVYPAQLTAKEAMATDTLSRIGGIETKVRSVMGSPETYGYRIRTRLHVRQAGNKVEVGYFARRSNTLVPLDACPLLAKPLNAVIKALPDLLPSPGTAPIPEEIQLQMSVDSGRVAIHLLGKGAVFGLETIFERCKKNQLPVLGVTADSKDGLIAAGEKSLTHRIGNISYRVGSNSFVQANQYLYKQMIDQAILLCSPAATDTVLDLYCGSGFFSLPIARFVQKLIGLDSNPAAIEDAKTNAAAASLKNSEFRMCDDRSFFRIPETTGARFSLVIADPPRTGFSPEALKGVIALKPAKMLYISCDPSTLARDLKHLAEADFRIRVIQPIDMFPHTYHLETLVFLTHKHTGAQAAHAAFSDLR